MISTDIIMLTSAIVVVLAFFTAWVWRGRFVAVNWVFFVAIGVIAGVRGWFYYSINLAEVHGRSAAHLIPLSRFIAEVVLITSALIAIGALVYYYVNVRLDK